MKIKFLLTLFFMIFLMSCAYQEFGSLDFSESAKDELRQLLQKPLPDAFDATYNFRSSLGAQSLADITFRNAKQGNNQRKDIFGHIFGFNLSAYSVINNNQQVTCALFDNEWKCEHGDEVCIEKDKGKLCQSVSQEGIPPTIKPEMLAKAKVAKTEQKQIIDVQVQCYKILSTEGGNKALTEVCFNQDGIIMSIAINAKLFQAIFEAKSYSTNAPSDAFILPAIVTKDEKAPKTKEAPALPPKPKSGRNTALTIISNPSGASVYLDDSFIGIAPISVQAPLGIHLVKCTLEGYVDAYTSVGVTEEGADAGVAGAEATCNMKR